jgi:hypothetical protein
MGKSPFELRLVSLKPALSTQDGLTETNYAHEYLAIAIFKTPKKYRLAAQCNPTPVGQDTKYQE